MSSSDQRIHSRVHVSAAIQVATADGTIDVELRDLSKGGARFLSPREVGKSGETVDLYLPSLNGQDVTVMAEIIRADPAVGGFDVAVRFSLVEPEQRQALVELIDELLASTGVGSEPLRGPRRIELSFSAPSELKALLEDILDGGLAMTVNEPLVLYEDLHVIVPDLGGTGLLILRSRVVHQRRIEVRPENPEAGIEVAVPRGEDSASFRVGLEFPDLRSEALGCLRELLRSVEEALNDHTSIAG